MWDVSSCDGELDLVVLFDEGFSVQQEVAILKGAAVGYYFDTVPVVIAAQQSWGGPDLPIGVVDVQANGHFVIYFRQGRRIVNGGNGFYFLYLTVCQAE